MADRVFEELGEQECLALIAPGGIGRIAYTGRYGPAVLPVNFALSDGEIFFRTAAHGALAEDLQTGITGADYRVAFEIDSFDIDARLGWSVLVQGPARHVSGDDEADQAARASGVEPWVPNGRDLFVRIRPVRVTGRRISPA
jgi:nitroimidazol reductase NimA-like FMN-containing flavoprotein (pyridoxamine 5'-phosphate oxidase superfamily)